MTRSLDSLAGASGLYFKGASAADTSPKRQRVNPSKNIGFWTNVPFMIARSIRSWQCPPFDLEIDLTAHPEEVVVLAMKPRVGIQEHFLAAEVGVLPIHVPFDVLIEIPVESNLGHVSIRRPIVGVGESVLEDILTEVELAVAEVRLDGSWSPEMLAAVEGMKRNNRFPPVDLLARDEITRGYMKA